MKAGDVISVYSDIKGKCKKGAKEFDGTKVFLGNGVSELSRKDIFNGIPDLKYVTKLCGGNSILSVVQKLKRVRRCILLHYINFSMTSIGKNEPIFP